MRLSQLAPYSRFTALLIATLAIQSIIITTGYFLRNTAVLGRTGQHEIALSGISNEKGTPSKHSDAQSVGIQSGANLSQGKQVQRESGREVAYKIAAGDTLTKIWTKNGASAAGGYQAAEAFKKAGIPLSSVRLNEEIHLIINSANEIVEFRKKLAEGKTLILSGSSTEGYTAVIDQEKVIEKEKVVSYPIESSFSLAAYEASVPNEIIDDLVDLYSGRLNFNRDLQPGDSFTVIYNERTTESGEVLSPGAIKAISIENNGKLLVAMNHTGKDGVVRFFDENGQQIGDYFLRYPLRFTRISSVFSKSRFHPVLHVNRPHNGVDFAAPIGTPVRSIADGIVENSGFSSSSGNMIKIRHDDRYTTAYLHLSKISSGIKAGSRVSRGQVIGAVGMTGLATAPHLHFALYDEDKFVDPLTTKLPLDPGRGNGIPKTLLASTLKTLQQQHQIVRLASLLGLSKRSV